MKPRGQLELRTHSRWYYSVRTLLSCVMKVITLFLHADPLKMMIRKPASSHSTRNISYHDIIHLPLESTTNPDSFEILHNNYHIISMSHYNHYYAKDTALDLYLCHLYIARYIDVVQRESFILQRHSTFTSRVQKYCNPIFSIKNNFFIVIRKKKIYIYKITLPWEMKYFKYFIEFLWFIRRQ